MATRTRVISQSKAVYSSPTGIQAGTVAAKARTGSGYRPDQLHRVDTFSFDIDLAGARTDVREFGQLARIGTITTSDINPTLSMGYYLGNGENEARLGLNVQGLTGASAGAQIPSSQFISGFQTEDEGKREKNIYLLTVKEGNDAFDATTFSGSRTFHDVVGFGNSVITNYTANFSVGEIPRVDLEMEAANVVFYTGQSSGLQNPSINDEGGPADTGQFRLDVPSTGDMDVLVLRPDDVTVEFSNPDFKLGGTNFDDMYIQSASVEVPLSRGNIEALGNERAVAKPVDFPIDITMNGRAIVKQFNDGALDLILTGTAGADTTDITLSVNNELGTLQHKFLLNDAVLDSQAFSLGLDDNETVDLTFSAQIGGASQTGAGLFYTGAFGMHTGHKLNVKDIDYVDSITGSILSVGGFGSKMYAKDQHQAPNGRG